MTDVPFHFELTEIPPATGELVNMIAIQACEAHEEKRLMTVHPEIILALTTLIEQNRKVLFDDNASSDREFGSMVRQIMDDDRAILDGLRESEIRDVQELDLEDAMSAIFGTPYTVTDSISGPLIKGKYQEQYDKFVADVDRDFAAAYPNGSARDIANQLQKDAGAVVARSDEEILERAQALNREAETTGDDQSRVWRAAKEKEMQVEGFTESDIRRVMELV